MYRHVIWAYLQCSEFHIAESSFRTKSKIDDGESFFDRANYSPSLKEFQVKYHLHTLISVILCMGKILFWMLRMDMYFFLLTFAIFSTSSIFASRFNSWSKSIPNASLTKVELKSLSTLHMYVKCECRRIFELVSYDTESVQNRTPKMKMSDAFAWRKIFSQQQNFVTNESYGAHLW